MGRITLPTEIKKLKGTLQPCRMNKNEPIPQFDLSPTKPPSILSTGAKKLWTYALEQMPPRLVTTLDGGLFARWCILQDQFIKLSTELKKLPLVVEDKNGKECISTILKAELAVSNSIITIEKELGFTPASRAKISLPTEEQEQNAFADLE